MRTRIGASIVAVILFVALTSADSTRGEIAGKVADEAGAALPGVQVTLSGSLRRAAVTDARGEFTFKSLPPGNYETRFELAGPVMLLGSPARTIVALGLIAMHLNIFVLGPGHPMSMSC